MKIRLLKKQIPFNVLKNKAFCLTMPDVGIREEKKA